MFIELTEVLVCPACHRVEGEAGRPPQGLVARVDHLEGRRVRHGSLGCPHCEARYPIRDGVVRFDREPSGEAALPGAEPPPGEGVAGPSEGTAGPPEDAAVPLEDPAEAAILVAALLGLQEGGTGYVLLGPGLAGVGGRLAAAAEGLEVVAIGEAAEEGLSGAVGEGPPSGTAEEGLSGAAGEAGVSVLAGLDPARLPLFSGRFRGVALAGGSAAAIEEVGRLLAPRGRLVVLAPSEEARQAVADGPLEVLASEPRALAAVRA